MRVVKNSETVIDVFVPKYRSRGLETCLQPGFGADTHGFLAKMVSPVGHKFGNRVGAI